MISEEKLRESIDTHIAGLLADEVYRRVNEKLQAQWDVVVAEMAATRRTLEHTKQALAESYSMRTKLDVLIEQLQTDSQKTKSLQEKEDKLLTFLMKEFEMEE